jgi:hypothetical protein
MIELVQTWIHWVQMNIIICAATTVYIHGIIMYEMNAGGLVQDI